MKKGCDIRHMTGLGSCEDVATLKPIPKLSRPAQFWVWLVNLLRGWF